MIRTYIEPCHVNRAEADALNRASGERYTQVAVFHECLPSGAEAQEL